MTSARFPWHEGRSLCFLRMSQHEKRDSVRSIEVLAVILRFTAHFPGTDRFNRNHQVRQHERLREGHVVCAEDKLQLRSQSSEPLYGSDIVIEIGLWTKKPDGR